MFHGRDDDTYALSARKCSIVRLGYTTAIGRRGLRRIESLAGAGSADTYMQHAWWGHARVAVK